MNIRFKTAAYLRGSALLTLAVLVTGCATQAQMQVKSTVASFRAANADYKACSDKAAANPAYIGLTRHMLLGAHPVGDIPLEMRMDKEYPTAEEANLLLAYHHEREPCRAVARAQLEFPFLVQTAAKGFSDRDEVLIALHDRKLTWGEANEATIRVGQQNAEANKQAAREWGAEMNALHRQEMAQRAETAAIIGGALATTAAVYEASRPVTTTCFGRGYFSSCTTR